ncbi:hypothetical protein MSL71_27290 [Desulfoluna butyratoxydans]|uniref:Transporter n=1 Tax=Desulfoluna butyratoxydans TaxID=231438 RepID=A0A4U8YT86_9BACT|nr:hypothetical protein MSL71_27290 [Desulfoluna butyratoxydans]
MSGRRSATSRNAHFCYCGVLSEGPPLLPQTKEILLTRRLHILPFLIFAVLFSSVALCEESQEVQQLKEKLQLLEERLSQMEKENDVRKELQSTEEEKKGSTEDVLSAAGRAYTLMREGALGLEYSFRYTGYTYDAIVEASKVEHNAMHSITNAVLVEYPHKDNITLSMNVPFVYKKNSSSGSDAKDVTDLGDVSFSAQWQPVKAGGGTTSKILSASLIVPTGRSPYKIDSTTEISTGSGGYAVSAGLSLSKPIDPLVAFGSILYQHGFDITGLNYKTGTQGEAGIYLSEVQPGDTYSLSMGIGYSLSYKVSLNLSYQYSYSMKTHYDWVGIDDTRSEATMSSTFSVGTGWNLSPRRSVNVKLNFGLTNNDPDFSVLVRVPFEFEL